MAGVKLLGGQRDRVVQKSSLQFCIQHFRSITFPECHYPRTEEFWFDVKFRKYSNIQRLMMSRRMCSDSP